MKNLLKASLILVALLTLHSCNNTKISTKKTIETPKKETLLLEIGNHNAGQFVIGKKTPKNLAENISITYKTRSKSEEGYTFTENYAVVTKNKNKLLTCILNKEDSTIVNISIFSDVFKTDKKIGINTTIEDFTTAYPDYTILFSYVSDQFVIATTTLKNRFILDEEDFIGDKNALYKSDYIPLKTKDFKTNSKIKLINIY